MVIITPEEIWDYYGNYDTIITDFFDLSKTIRALQKISPIIPYLESHYLGIYCPNKDKAYTTWKGNVPEMIHTAFDLSTNDYVKFTEKLVNLIIDDHKFKKLEVLKAFW